MTIDREAIFDRSLFDLVQLALGSNRTDLLLPAALITVNADPKTEVGKRGEYLRRTVDTAIRRAIVDQKLTCAKLDALTHPLTEAGLFTPGYNAFSPATVAARISEKQLNFTMSMKIIDVSAGLTMLLPHVVTAIFSHQIVEVVDHQVWCDSGPDVGPAMLRALASRPDIPLTCLVPTATALLEIAIRVLAAEVCRRCKLPVPVDLSGIEPPPHGQALCVVMPKNTEPRK